MAQSLWVSAHPSCLGPVPSSTPLAPGLQQCGPPGGRHCSGRLGTLQAKLEAADPRPCPSLSGCLLGGLVCLPGEGGHRVPPGSMTSPLRGPAGRSPQDLPSFLAAAG